MACVCVVGLQWGDEAKGKIVDLLTADHDFVVRFNGGANAGHTVVHGDQVFKLSLLPTGAIHPEVTSVIGNGLVIYPPRLMEEIQALRQGGIEVGSNLCISNHAHVIFPYHLAEEKLNETSRSGSIGTTGRGIGPCYMDKMSRTWGVRVEELLHPAHLLRRLELIVERKNRILQALAGSAPPPAFKAQELCEQYTAYGKEMRPFIQDTAQLLQEAVKSGKNILFEAAQGALLDIDHGTYPYVTSSNSSVAGAWNGSGVSARQLDRVIGIIKSYTTRVGRGPFPTELDDGPNGIGERIRQKGKEFGTVTGRPRRCGWLDTVALRYTAAISDVDEVAITLLDVLSGLEEVCLCTGYQFEGDVIQTFPGDSFQLEQCKPVLERMPGWKEEITGARKLGDLPSAARSYLDRISELLERPVSFVSVGPDREQTIFCN